MGYIPRVITLVQLPPELLHLILSPLDAYDLVRVRQTCKALKGMIDNSEILQYVIDLSYFQMIPMGSSEMDAPPAICRKRLRQYNAAWQRFEYTRKCTLPSMMLGPLFKFSGGVYGSLGDDCIHFIRLPSATDSNELHCWSHPDDPLTSVDFTFCAAQDLLAVVAHSPDLTHAYDIHLRSLATNDIHTDAPQPILKVLDRDIIDHMIQPTGHVDVQIMGKYISLLVWDIVVNDIVVGDYMQMWDWTSKTGYQFTLLFHNGIDDCSFIAEDKFLVLDHRGTVEIYCVADRSKPPLCTAKLALPSLVNHFSYTHAFTSENMILGSMFPYSRKSYQPICSFHPSTNDQLIAVHVAVAGTTDMNSVRDFHYYSFFILRSAILELESLFAKTCSQPTLNGPKLPWSMWGPQHTTWFQLPRDDEDWESSLYGFRVVEPITVPEVPREHRRLRIRDFNPHIARNYHAQDKSGWHGRLVEGELIGTISRPFTEPLGSALPYREVVSEELFDLDNPLIDESRILLLKKDQFGELQQIDVLVF